MFLNITQHKAGNNWTKKNYGFWFRSYDHLKHGPFCKDIKHHGFCFVSGGISTKQIIHLNQSFAENV